MTKKDLFRILIKIFALYFVIQTVFTVIPQSYIFFIGGFEWGSLLTVVLTLALVLLFLYLLITKADWIISILKLEKGFDDDFIKFEKISPETILKMFIILLGGIFIIVNIGTLLTLLSFAFREIFIPQEGALHKFTPEVDILKLIISAINIFIGYLIITNCKRLTSWLKKKEFEGNET